MNMQQARDAMHQGKKLTHPQLPFIWVEKTNTGYFNNLGITINTYAHWDHGDNRAIWDCEWKEVGALDKPKSSPLESLIALVDLDETYYLEVHTMEDIRIHSHIVNDAIYTGSCYGCGKWLSNKLKDEYQAQITRTQAKLKQDENNLKRIQQLGEIYESTRT